jgi:ribosomal protein L40E
VAAYDIRHAFENAVTLKDKPRWVTAVFLALSLLSIVGSTGVQVSQAISKLSSTQLELTMKYEWPIGSDMITGTFKNDGDQAIGIIIARVFLDIVPAELAGNCSEGDLVPSQACSFSITPGFSNNLIASGSGHSLVIVIPNNQAFWFTVFYSNTPVHHQQSSSGLTMEDIGLVANDWTSVVVLKLLIQNAKSTPVNLAASWWTIGIWTGPNSINFVKQTGVTYSSYSTGSSVSSLLPGGTVIVTIKPNRAFSPGVLNLGGVYYYPLDLHLPDGSDIGLPCCTPGEAYPPVLQPYTTTTASSNIESRTTTSSQAASFAVPPHYDYYFWVDLNSGDTIAFSFSVSSWRGADGVSFTLVSSTRSVLLNVGRVNQYSGNYTAIFAGRYYLRFDNSYSILTTKTISLSYTVIPRILGIEAYTWNEITISGSLRNYGTSLVDTRNAQVSLGEMVIGNLGGTCGETLLNPGSSCTFSITVPNGSWVSGTLYVLKLLTPSGSFSFPVVAEGNSESIIQTQPNLITFQTVNTETTVEVQPGNQAIFSQDYFLKNTFAMIGVLAGGILLIGAILGISAISVATRNRGKGLYGEDENKSGDSRRSVPLLVIVAAGALGLLTVSTLTPLLTINFASLASSLPYLLPTALLAILITSTLSFAWILTAILRGRRKAFRSVQEDHGDIEIVSQSSPQVYELSIEPKQVEMKICHYCGAEVPRADMICRKCGMPTMYRK